MDEFVALTALYGLKPRGKSAPMAAVGFDDFSVFDELIKLSSTNDSGDNDLLGGLTGLSPNEDGFDELIPGFGGSGQPSNNEFGVDDDLDSLFNPVELPRESDKRRLWEREKIIKDRMEKAIADMNNRDHQIQTEQEERSRISETLDGEIKLWATGKEGNLRALISSLHLVLWPGCGWEAVSLTDFTYASVKKVYKKANLYVHPDKVHQKGAQQKYIAKKVFNILQEAWNKFNKEELS
uniref:J domain-containing protein n=1 Tax=Brassica oleracea var. oleracea TaxID=109376 RepID=A0A0D3D1D2_BRAOL